MIHIYLWIRFCLRHISVLSIYYPFLSVRKERSSIERVRSQLVRFRCNHVTGWNLWDFIIFVSDTDMLCPLPTITFALNAIISVILVPIRMGYINEYSGVSIAYVFPSNWSILWWRRPSTYRYTRVSIVFSIQFTSKCSNRMKNKTKLETFVNNNNNESKLIYYSIGDYDYGWKTLVQYNVHTRHNEWHAK